MGEIAVLYLIEGVKAEIMRNNMINIHRLS